MGKLINTTNRILLVLFALPLVFVFIGSFWLLPKDVEMFLVALVVGSFGPLLVLYALTRPTKAKPDTELTGIPADSELPEGVFSIRSWIGFFGNIPSAVIVDTNQRELVFIRCLGSLFPDGNRTDTHRISINDIRYVEEEFYYGRRQLTIWTNRGSTVLKSDLGHAKYVQLVDFLKANLQEDAKRFLKPGRR